MKSLDKIMREVQSLSVMQEMQSERASTTEILLSNFTINEFLLEQENMWVERKDWLIKVMGVLIRIETGIDMEMDGSRYYYRIRTVEIQKTVLYSRNVELPPKRTITL